ncbi:MAG: hypothetical protein NZM31_02225 [Gemmatales bacterium]|nr:hypothetical protein [Gemmatales bacterium]MDW8385814.1 hypothetical protein [Gemmatales bacterium]
MDTAWVVLGVAGSVALFVLVWVGIAVAVSHFGGWKALANRYEAHLPFAGTCWNWQTIVLGDNSQYSNCMKVGVDQDGLYLVPNILFRVAHVPLFIPWSDIDAQWREKSMLGISSRYVELRLTTEPDLKICVPKDLIEKIQAELLQLRAADKLKIRDVAPA